MSSVANVKTRRRFLTVLAAASVGGACADDDSDDTGAGGSVMLTSGVGGREAEADLPDGYELVGNVTGLPVGAFVEGFGLDLIFGRDELGVYAMTSRCTHQECNMINNDGIVRQGVIRCGCHGSEFDATGTPMNGPANRQLEHFAVFVDDNGFIGVNRDMEVDPSTRAPV